LPLYPIQTISFGPDASIRPLESIASMTKGPPTISLRKKDITPERVTEVI